MDEKRKRGRPPKKRDEVNTHLMKSGWRPVRIFTPNWKRLGYASKEECLIDIFSKDDWGSKKTKRGN